MANSAIDRLIFSESPMSSQQTGDDLLRQGHFPEASLHYIQALHDAHHPTPSEEPESESGSPPPPDSDLITSLEEKLAQCDRFTACQDPSFVNVVQVAWGRQSEDQLLGRWEPSEFLLNQFPPGKYTEGSELYEIQIVQRRKALEEARENCRKKFRLPRLVQPLQGDGVITGACGHKASGVVTATGQLLMWGYNGAGLLGQGDRTDRKSPERVTQFFKSSPLAKEKLHQVFTSTSFDEPRLSQDQEEETEEVTYNLTTPTETSSSSSKGHGFAPVRQAETRSRLPPKREVVYSFEYDRLLPAVRIVQVTVSYEHSLALASDGRVFSCGRNTHGQLGNGDVDSVVNPFFVMIRDLEDKEVVQIASGWFHSLARTRNGGLYVWGQAKKGALGLGVSDDACQPRPTQVPLDLTIQSMAAGMNHTLILTHQGQVLSCGDDYYGQLGRSATKTNPRQEFCLLEDLSRQGVRQIAAGANHSVALTNTGIVYSWGHGKHGQLGFGYGNDYSLPHHIPFFQEKNVLIRHIAAGGDKTACVTMDGRFFTFGLGSFSLGAIEYRPILSDKLRGEDKSELHEVALGFHHMSLFLHAHPSLAHGLKGQVDQSLWSDVTFRVGDVSIQAHRVILLCRSLTFQSLFARYPVGEEIPLTNISAENLRVVIRYCYTSHALVTTENIQQILSFAQEYRLLSLINLCESMAHGSFFLPPRSLGYLPALNDPRSYYSDVTLVLEGYPDDPFPCHRIILASRCEYFAAMFGGSFVESNSKEIVLHAPVSPDLFSCFLHFLYVGTLERFRRNETDAISLLALATEYQLPELTAICSSVLQQEVGEDNVVSIAQVAFTYDIHDLQERCIRFMSNPIHLKTLRDGNEIYSLPDEILERVDPTLCLSDEAPGCLTYLSQIASIFSQSVSSSLFG